MKQKLLIEELYKQMKNGEISIFHAFKTDFQLISWKYILSEDIIREFKDKWDWNYISLTQKISFEFIIEFIEYIFTDCLKVNTKLNFTPEQYATIENLKQMHRK